MRPVNLIPPEERRGESAPTRSGPLAYIIVALLALALAAVTATVLFDKRVGDRKAEVAALEGEAEQLQAEADSLSAFTSFQQLRDARVATIDELARSRFDWERVLRELSEVMPEHVWLTSLNGSVAPGAGSDDSGASALRESIPGPALAMTGCGRSHRDVARLVAAMKDIDGVTRVTASDSAKSDSKVTQAASGDGTETDTECQTESAPQFSLIAAFDAVAPTADPDGVPTDPATTTATTTTTATETTTTPETGTTTTPAEAETAAAGG